MMELEPNWQNMAGSGNHGLDLEFGLTGPHPLGGPRMS